MDEPRRTTLDIIMPFYGSFDHFREAVDSVRAQDDPDWRLVVIDDCYPDEEPGRWLTALEDPRIEYVRNPQNIGINANFQKSIDLARAEFVTIMGCDDRLLPGYVGLVKELAGSSTADIVHVGVRSIDDQGVAGKNLVDRTKDYYRPSFSGRLTLGGETLARSLMRGNWMYFPALAWRRETIAAHGFRPDLQVVQDLALTIDVILDGGSLVLDDTVAFEYRRHAASVSSWRAADGSRFEEEQTFFLTSADEFSRRGWTQAARAARRHFSSRLNAATRIPGALAARRGPELRVLFRYSIGLPVAAAPAVSGRAHS